MSIGRHMVLIWMSLTGCISILSVHFNWIRMVGLQVVIKEERVCSRLNQIMKRINNKSSIFPRFSDKSQEENQSLHLKMVVLHPRHPPCYILPRLKLNNLLDKIQCPISEVGHFWNHWIQNCCPEKHSKTIWRSQGTHSAPYHLPRSVAHLISQITPEVQRLFTEIHFCPA